MREVDGELVLLNPASGRYYGLDRVGLAMWEALAAGDSVGDGPRPAARALRRGAPRLDQDLERLIGELEARGARGCRSRLTCAGLAAMRPADVAADRPRRCASCCAPAGSARDRSSRGRWPSGHPPARDGRRATRCAWPARCAAPGRLFPGGRQLPGAEPRAGPHAAPARAPRRGAHRRKAGGRRAGGARLGRVRGRRPAGGGPRGVLHPEPGRPAARALRRRGDRDRARAARRPARAGRRATLRLDLADGPRERGLGAARGGDQGRRLAAVGPERARRRVPASARRQLRDRARPLARARDAASRARGAARGRGAGLPGQRPGPRRGPARAGGAARQRRGHRGGGRGLRGPQRRGQEHRRGLAGRSRGRSWWPRTCWCWSRPETGSWPCRAAARSSSTASGVLEGAGADPVPRSPHKGWARAAAAAEPVPLRALFLLERDAGGPGAGAGAGQRRLRRAAGPRHRRRASCAPRRWAGRSRPTRPTW